MGSASHFQRSPGLDDQAGSFPNWIGSDLGPDLMAQIQLGACPQIWACYAYLGLIETVGMVQMGCQGPVLDSLPL